MIVRLLQPGIVRATNEAGLSLTAAESRALAETDATCLAENGRVAFGEGAVVRIVREFADSPFVAQDNAAKVLGELTQAFYEVREDFPASVTDAEIVESLRKSFDEEAAGDAQLAADSARESLAKREGSSVYEIADDNGDVYRWNPEEWRDDVMADGWYGERWEDADE